MDKDKLNELRVEDWTRESKFVLSELRRMSEGIETINRNFTDDLTSMKVTIATLQTKVALYAFIAAAVASAVLSAVINFIMKR